MTAYRSELLSRREYFGLQKEGEIIKEEKDLLEKAKEGDQGALKELITQNKQRVAATIIGMIGQSQEADDIGQETFIRFYKNLHKFRGDARIGTYLTRIAINLSINEIRRRKKNRLQNFFPPDFDINSFPDKNERNAQKDIRKITQKALMQLDYKFRIVIVLRFINGYTTEETAKILKLPMGTILSRFNRAQKKLREILEPLIGDSL